MSDTQNVTGRTVRLPPLFVSPGAWNLFTLKVATLVEAEQHEDAHRKIISP